MRIRPLFFAAACGLSAIGIFVACTGDDPATTTTPIDSGTQGDSNAPPPPPPPPGPPPAPPPGDGGADADARYCNTRVAPPGSDHFFCADFDGTDAGEGWTATERDDGGTLATTTAVATSPPNGLVAHAQQGNLVFGGGAFTWTTPPGAKNVAQIVLHADVNPAALGGVVPNYSGHVKLLEVSTPDAAVRLVYTRGGNLGLPASMTNYTGYYVQASTSGGAAALSEYAAPTILSQLPVNTWRTITLTYLTSGTAKIDINGVTVFTQAVYGTTQTTASAIIGEVAAGQVTMPQPMRYDNVDVVVTRDP